MNISKIQANDLLRIREMKYNLRDGIHTMYFIKYNSTVAARTMKLTCVIVIKQLSFNTHNRPQ